MHPQPRQPLRDVPLDQVLSFPPSTHGPHSPFKSPGGALRPGKRPADALLSPAKRRLLGNIEQRSPEPRQGSPLASSSRAAPPTLPSRRLEFSAVPPTPERHTTVDITTSTGHRPAPALASSPELHPRTIAPASPKPTRRATPASPRRGQPVTSTVVGAARVELFPAHVPLLVPRELPPPPDRSSVHYPGFDVYMDTHIRLPHARDRLAASLGDAGPIESMREADKENMPMRRRAKRPVSLGGGTDFSASLLPPVPRF